MKIAIVCSLKDPASMNIRTHLLNKAFLVQTEKRFDGEIVYEFEKGILVTITTPQVFREGIDTEIKNELGFEADVLLFASKHSSTSGSRTLTVHPIGNLSEQTLGGKPLTVSPSASWYLRNAYHLIKKSVDEQELDYEVSVEATHHGPFTTTPSVFIEIGSTPQEWNDESAGQLMADVFEKLVTSDVERTRSIVVCGGGHYCQVANKILERSEYAIGHIISKYAIESLTKELVETITQSDINSIEFFALDWKGLGKGKPHLLELLDSLGIEYRKTKTITSQEQL